MPGGSSGGSAAAVAGGEAVAALGTDTGGSIRQPALPCGRRAQAFYGRVSRYGVTAYASSLDQVGPMTKTVEDAAVRASAAALVGAIARRHDAGRAGAGLPRRAEGRAQGPPDRPKEYYI